jgi:predicted PurR-regulated permease PerM
VILTVALYPAFEWLSSRVGGRRGIAAAILTLVALAVVGGPTGMLAASLADTLAQLAAELRAGTLRVPQPPAGMAEWPLVGKPAAEFWGLAANNMQQALAEYGPTFRPAAGAVLVKLAALGGDLLLFLVSVALSGFLFLPAPRLAAGARQFATRIVQPRGAHFVELAGATIRGVSRGVVGVAFFQSIWVGVALIAAGVPGAGLLAFAVLVLCIVQIGPALIVLPVIVWAWMTLAGSAALVLTIALVPVIVIDNVLKPILISRGLTTPMLVILIGVIGGTISHGLIGLFLGPIVLAVFYELVIAWMHIEPAETSRAAP